MANQSSGDLSLMQNADKVIKEGWLYREEVVAGSLSTWKKRWNVLTLLKLQCFKMAGVCIS